MKTPYIFALSVAFALSALAQGPGGGGGGFTPGGGGSSGAFNYDSIASDTTNSDHTVFRTAGGLLYRYASAPTAIAPPAAVTPIADGLFAGCTFLVTADLSATAIAEIPSDCFAGCTALESVILPDTCTAIGPNAFAGCTALSSVTAPGVTAIAADAFRGCANLNLLPAFAEGAALGEWSFAGSGLESADLSTLVPSAGAFAGCTSLASAINPPADLPDALFAGCTALSFDPSPCETIGQAALAGVPFDTIPLRSATLGPYAFAAHAATVDTLLDCPYPESLEHDATSFLGRAVSYDTGDGIAPLEAADLVAWLREQATAEAPLVGLPDTYATADLETWLKTSDNAETYAYASQITAAPSFAALTFSDDAQGFVVVPPDDGISVTATPVACYSLSVASPEWLASNLVQDPDSGVYYPAEETSVCFATLRFSWDW